MVSALEFLVYVKKILSTLWRGFTRYIVNLSPYSQRPAPVPPEMEIIDKPLDYINIVESVSKWQGVLLLIMLLIGWGISIFQLLLLVEVSSITCHDRSL